MNIGVTIFITDRSVRPDRLGAAVEDRGFQSLYVSEHTHIPTERRTPWPPYGDDLPEEYKRTYDPFVSLTAAATTTERIRLGTSICLVAQRDPIVTAKSVASLDDYSRGRFTFGVGFGWNVDEIADHGVDFKQRWDVVREHMLVMRALWADEPTGFEGSYARVSPSWAYPKPVDRPQPPVLVGGRAGPRLFRHIAEYADGWISMGGAGVRAALPALRAAEAAAGRPEGDLSVAIMSEADPAKLAYYAELGVSEVICVLPSDDERTVLDRLDSLVPILEFADPIHLPDENADDGTNA